MLISREIKDRDEPDLPAIDDAPIARVGSSTEKQLEDTVVDDFANVLHEANAICRLEKRRRRRNRVVDCLSACAIVKPLLIDSERRQCDAGVADKRESRVREHRRLVGFRNHRVCLYEQRIGRLRGE